MEIVIYLALILIGAALGSFAGATVWRLRARQLKQDKKDGEKLSESEYARLKPLMNAKLSKDRSRCLSCGHTLKWFELIPIVSWLIQRGKCRDCHKKIGKFELLIELGVAAFFVLSYVLWPFPLDNTLEIIRLVIWLAAGVCLAILFAYDAKWYLLPDGPVFTLIGLGVVTVALTSQQSGNVFGTLFTALIAALILSGIYLGLYLISRGKWVGFGDVKLGLGLALLLVDWEIAFIALFLANFIGCLYVIPQLLSKKLSRGSRVPFGPLLILGAVAAQFFGTWVVEQFVGVLL